MQHEELYINLRQRKKDIKNMLIKIKDVILFFDVCINKRPKIIDSRARFGNFEADKVIGANHKQALVTIAKRKSDLTFIKKVPNRTAKLTSKAIVESLSSIKSKLKNTQFWQ